MLPFLKPKKIASVISARTMSNEGKQMPEDIKEHSSDFMACAHAMMSAISNKDAEALAEALQKLQSIDAAIDDKAESKDE